MTLSHCMSNRAVSFGYYHPDFESIYLPTLVHRFTRDLSSSSDKVSSDTSVTDKQPLLTPNQGLSNVDDIIPDDFHAKEALRSLKSSFEEASSTTLALTARDVETTVLGKHPLTPPDQDTANVTDAAAKDFRSFNSAFTPFKVAPAVEQGRIRCPHSSDPPRKPAPLVWTRLQCFCSKMKCRLPKDFALLSQQIIQQQHKPHIIEGGALQGILLCDNQGHFA